ncbi:MAG: hypothetical protein M3436_17405 [Pseudomonadota bacterium]|nr:hypothetical protein [Pseudomonadota bacterium]
MRAPLLWLLLASRLAGATARALDMTPIPSFKELEGFKVPIVTFKDGDRKISYQPPSGWQLSGGGAQLRLFPSRIAECNARFEVFKRKPLPDANAREELRKWAATLLPDGAEDIQAGEEYENTFMFGPIGNREFLFTYTANGNRFSASVAIADLNEQQRFVATTIARANDFETMRREVISSMFRWAWDE